MNKIKVTAGIAAAAISALTLAACGGSGAQQGDSTASAAVAAKDYNGFYKHTADVYKNYVKLGEYKGLDVTKIDRSNEQVTDEDVNNQIEALKAQYTETQDVTEGGTTQKDDIITIDYTGKINGVEFEGGSAQGRTYTVGSGQFIEDLDKGLEGKQAGQDFDVNAKFPDDYGKEELNGKDAVFTVKISQIMRPSEPEINDDFVKAHADDLAKEGFGTGLATLDALKNGIKTSLAESAKKSNDQQVLGEVIEKLKETSEIKDYPAQELESLKTNRKSNLEQELEQYNSYMSQLSGAMVATDENGETVTAESTETTAAMTLDEYVKVSYGAENADAYVDEFAKGYLATKMLVTLIADENNIDVSVDDINKAGEELASYYGYNSYQEIVEKFGAEVNCDTGYQVLYNKVSTLIAENSNEVKEAESEEAPATEETQASEEQSETSEAAETETTTAAE